MRYRVEYEDGVQVDCDLRAAHPSFIEIIEAANIERARVEHVPHDSIPVRIFRIALGAVGEDIGIESCIWTGPRSKSAEPKTVRLFVSFAYLDPAPHQAMFGNVMIDIQFEPFEPDHIEHLQQLIEQQTERQSVTLLGWQRVGR